MRQERNYFRQLKSVKHEINELYPSARHAYIAIGLAVKTGRPHNVIPAKAGISHFFIKELSLHLAQSKCGRSQNLALQDLGRAIGRTRYLPLSLTRSAKVTHIHQTIKSLLTLPITLILVNNYTKIIYEVRNHQGT